MYQEHTNANAIKDILVMGIKSVLKRVSKNVFMENAGKYSKYILTRSNDFLSQVFLHNFWEIFMKKFKL